jgi:Uma2 family endonuclease
MRVCPIRWEFAGSGAAIRRGLDIPQDRNYLPGVQSKTRGLPPHTEFLWSRTDYEDLVARGIFGPEDKLELLGGHLITMSPQKTPHATAIRKVRHYLQSVFNPETHLVDSQAPLALDDRSEPEPDVAVFRGTISDFADHHPTAAETVLVIEIADTSLQYDRTRKLPAYARAGIPEYWILNLSDRTLELFREPSGDTYLHTEILSQNELASPRDKDLQSLISDLLP